MSSNTCSWSRCAALALLLALPSGAQGGVDAALEALSQSRFSEALAALESEPDELTRLRTRSDVFWYGRDYAGCVDVAAQALDSGVSDAHLAWRAAGGGLWLREPQIVEAWSQRLETAVAAGDGADAATADWWMEQASLFRASAGDLLEGQTQRTAARGRARGLSLTVLGLAGLAFLVMLLRSNSSATDQTA